MALRVPAPLAALALLAALLPPSLQGQSRGRLPKLLTLPASTRAMALGGAYQPPARHSDAIFYNPAFVNGSTGMGVEVQQWGRAATAAAASAALAWYGGSVAIGLQSLQFGIAATSVPDGEEHLFEAGPTPVSERLATAAYARTIHGIEWGVAGKLAEERIGGVRSTTVLLDAGAARRAGPLTFGVSVLDLGDRPFDGRDGLAPPRVILGAGAYGHALGIFDLGYAAALTYTEDRTAVGGGVEVGYWPVTGRTFLLRLGVERPPTGNDAIPYSLGLAFWGDDLRLEWAYQRVGGASGSHRFGIAWH